MHNKYSGWIILIVIIILAAWTIRENVMVSTTYYDISDTRIPEKFTDYRIAQVSDLHNSSKGNADGEVIQILEKENPDIIVITGDLVDSNKNENALSFLEKAVQLAPCYYVTGNHEAAIGEDYDLLEVQMKTLEVNVLHNQSVKLEQNGAVIQLTGIDDPNYADDYLDSGSVAASEIAKAGKEDMYCILLSHRPEIFDTYVEENIPLVLTGHAHGGQFRLPFVGGFIAPNQGFFPKYDNGIYRDNDTTMIVSRGVGNSIIPIRINNQPEVVIIRLHNIK